MADWTGMDFVKDSVFNNKYEWESQLIDLKKYFDDYCEALQTFGTCQNENCKLLGGCEQEDCKTNETFKNFLGISMEELAELKEKTSIKHLTCDGETDYYKVPENILDDIQPKEKNEVISPLISVNKRLEMMDVIKTKFPRTYYKYCNNKWCIRGEKQLMSKLEFNNLEFPTVIATIKIYQPFLSTNNRRSKIKYIQEIHILGNQSLSQLRDKIVCPLDYIGDKDVSKECFLKDIGYNVMAKDEYPSSFIFIENTFYIDTRSEKHKDLSEELREWAAKREFPKFETSIMENTKICDLKVKIGRPYVFQHQGNCEHIILFSDVRLLNGFDPQKYAMYPLIHSIGRIYGRRCMMCSDFYAKWLVVGNERLTHDKAYLCNKCFTSYNYVKGKKIGKFKAFRYVDPIAIL